MSRASILRQVLGNWFCTGCWISCSFWVTFGYYCRWLATLPFLVSSRNKIIFPGNAKFLLPWAVPFQVFFLLGAHEYCQQNKWNCQQAEEVSQMIIVFWWMILAPSCFKPEKYIFQLCWERAFPVFSELFLIM